MSYLLTVAFVGNIFGSLILDKVGRRLLLLIGFAACIVCVTVNAAIIAQYGGTNNSAAFGVAPFAFANIGWKFFLVS